MKALNQLAHFKGILNEYINVDKERTRVPDQTVIGLLRALGVPVQDDAANAAELLTQARHEYWSRPLEPVTVAWNGILPNLLLRVPESTDLSTLTIKVTLEDSGERALSIASIQRSFACEVLNERFETACVKLGSHELPLGYHQLHLSFGDSQAQSHVISSPEKAYALPDKKWLGVFAPMYALRSEHNWGAGDLRDFAELQSWAQANGAQVVGTLPMLAQFLGKPALEPSPYSPASRLFWNEFFLNIESILEYHASPRAQALVKSRAFQDDLDAARAAELVDYEKIAKRKRQVLKLLANEFWSSSSPRKQEFCQFLETHPDIREYAQFRAHSETHGLWTEWTNPLSPVDENNSAFRYYAYTQWLLHSEIENLDIHARKNGPGLYLDLPLGVHSGGYDTWKYRKQFLTECVAGAPPDGFFRGGQNWAFHPLNPESQREAGYDYFRKFLAHHMSACGILRVDHVMGLSRLYCIPPGAEVKDGTYIRYKAKELFALIILESHRNRTAIIGEDLGVVPTGVRMAMERHELSRMFIAPFEWDREVTPVPLNEIPQQCLAAVNTHDMPPFAGMVLGEDVRFQRRMEWLTNEQEQQIMSERKEFAWGLATAFKAVTQSTLDEDQIRDILKATLSFIARSPASIQLLNMEDFWLEKFPQNVPGTSKEWPNWRHKFKWTMNEITKSAILKEWLVDLNKQRQS